MPKFELIKTIEARKLNKRSKLPLSEPMTTIPYAAILDDVEQDRDVVNFTHLGELFQCSYTVFVEAARAMRAEEPAPAASAAPAESKPAAKETPPVMIQWENLASSRYAVARAKVPGGWLVALRDGDATSLAFYPDPDHRWSGGSL